MATGSLDELENDPAKEEGEEDTDHEIEEGQQWKRGSTPQ